MKTLVVYDSAYGNTAQVARTIAGAIGDDVRVAHADEVDADRLNEYELVLVGSPTQGGRATALMRGFLRRIPEGSLKGVAVTGFDTRIDGRAQGFVMRTFMGLLGYAAGRIARQLEGRGGTLVTQPEGFCVDGKEGPLSHGEEARAAVWGATIARTFAATH